jgi:hypothetical protein
MLTKNLWQENGLANGSMVTTVRDIFWREASTATDQPHGIMVEFDGYTGYPYLAWISKIAVGANLCYYCQI